MSLTKVRGGTAEAACTFLFDFIDAGFSWSWQSAALSDIVEAAWRDCVQSRIGSRGREGEESDEREQVDGRSSLHLSRSLMVVCVWDWNWDWGLCLGMRLGVRLEKCPFK